MKNLQQCFEQKHVFGMARIIFGLACVINIAFHVSPAWIGQFPHHFNADWVAGQPAWLAQYGHWMANLVAAIGAHAVAVATVVLEGLLAASLLTGLALPAMAWVGVVYNLWLWSTIGGLGGPYTAGATDPGTAIVYALCFLLVILSRSWEGLSLARGVPRAASPRAMRLGQILFGLLWAFDAYWKWQPYFITHSITYLQQALPGEPAWIAAYITLFIAILKWVGPVIFGVGAAIIETVIAAALLANRAVRWIIPIGIAYSLGVWTTAEGWGAPYGPGFTANKGDVLGTTNIYAIAFLFLAGWIYFRPRVTDAPAPN